MQTTKKIALAIEFFVLYVALPTVIILGRLAPYMLFALWIGYAYCYCVYKKTRLFQCRDLMNFDAFKWINIKPVLIRWLLCCIGMVVFLYLYDPERMLSLITHNALLWLAIMLLYPPLSALPQQFIYCCYFFERYKPVFGKDWLMIIMSAIVFGYAHFMFLNVVAPTLSLFAGFIFALTYHRTRSLSFVTFEHALYGNALFTIGLGWYFYGGGIHH